MEINSNQENGQDTTEINNYSRTDNISASDLDEDTTNKLRGDAIGDTLYSQSFVLKTLLQFSDLQWSQEVEDDLCFLWDMTVESEVCKYLFELSFPSLARAAVAKYAENRFIEIVVGILANILCADCEKSIAEEEILTVLNELDTDDPLILIQVMRFLSAVAHMSEKLPFISADTMDKIQFVLCNSTNSDLLLKTLEVVAKLTTDFKLNKDHVNTELIASSLVAYQLLMNDNDTFDLDTRKNQLTCRYFLEIVSNVCGYFNETDLLEFRKHSSVYVDEICKIAKYYSYEENLLPITDEVIFYISIFRFVLQVLDAPYRSDLFLSLTRIFYVVSCIEDEVGEVLEPLVELECFLLSRGNLTVIRADFKKLPSEIVKKTLKVVDENKNKYEFKLDIGELLMKYK